MSILLGTPSMPPRAPKDVGHLRGDRSFQKAAHVDLYNATQRRNLHKATHTIRAKRANVISEIDDWEDLREAGSGIKRDVMARMPERWSSLRQPSLPAAVTCTGRVTPKKQARLSPSW